MDNQSSLKGVNEVLIGVNHISTLVSVNTHNGQLRFNAEQDGSPRGSLSEKVLHHHEIEQW